jgi:hypothetical protein
MVRWNVDLYRIDDELGPIKVSSFTTRDLKPLASRKTPEPDAVPQRRLRGASLRFRRKFLFEK